MVFLNSDRGEGGGKKEAIRLGRDYKKKKKNPFYKSLRNSKIRVLTSPRAATTHEISPGRICGKTIVFYSSFFRVDTPMSRRYDTYILWSSKKKPQQITNLYYFIRTTSLHVLCHHLRRAHPESTTRAHTSLGNVNFCIMRKRLPNGTFGLVADLYVNARPWFFIHFFFFMHKYMLVCNTWDEISQA